MRIRFWEGINARSVAYDDLGGGDPAEITTAYGRRAGPVIEEHLEKA